MPNDTPNNDSPDSQIPFISQRNEGNDLGVASGMDTTEGLEPENNQQQEDSPQWENSPQSTVNSPQSEEEGRQLEDSQQFTVDSEQSEQDGGQSEDSQQFTVDSGESEQDGPRSTVDGPRSEEDGAGALDTGELEEVSAATADSENGERTTDNVPTDNVPSDNASPDPVPTVAFDYDDYYGVPETPQRPIPVSERIEQTATKEKKRSNVPVFLGAIAAGIVGALVTVGVLTATGTFDTAETPTTTVASASEAVATIPIPAATTQIINDLGSAINPTAVASKVVPSIVTVNVFEDGSGTEDGFIGVGSGSGVVVSRDGYIITNNHVVDGATEYRVTFEDGRVYTAELVGTDELTDLAVLQITADNLVPIDLGSSDELELGDPAIAVGNPLGQDGGASVSVGIISAFDRRVDFADSKFLHGMIQTDAAINSGSSGGALVNAEGELIGITSAIGVSQAGPEGIGYAIPVELVKRISDEIIETGDVQHPFLGVTIGTYLDEASDGAIVPAGAEIQTIEGTDSAAGKAGLQPGDIIVRIGDKPIQDQTDLILAVRLYRVGDEVEFEAIRDGESVTVTVEMGQRPAEFGG